MSKNTSKIKRVPGGSLPKKKFKFKKPEWNQYGISLNLFLTFVSLSILTIFTINNFLEGKQNTTIKTTIRPYTNVQNFRNKNIGEIREIKVAIQEEKNQNPLTTATENQEKGELATYTIQNGDTLYTIANKFGISLTELINLNEVVPPYEIKPDSELIIPNSN